MFRNSFMKVIFCGHLGADADIRKASVKGDEVSVGTFRLATNEVFKSRVEGVDDKEHTEWARFQIWRGLCDGLGPYLKKGKQVMGEGRLRTTSYRKEGEETDRYTTDILVDELTLIGSGNGRSARDPHPADLPVDVPADDIPF